MKFVKKPIVIDAIQWFKLGDHPAVYELNYHGAMAACRMTGVPSIGDNAARLRATHGQITTLEGDLQIVTPGDWIITGINGEHYPCKDHIFRQTYDPVATE